MIGLDETGIVHAVNLAAEGWLGLPVGRPFSSCFDADDAPTVDALCSRGWVGASEQRLALVDGRRVSLNAGAVGGLAPVAWQVALRDITHRLVIDDVQEEQRRVAALAELAGAVARDLNDPVSNVLGRLELVVELGDEVPPMVAGHLGVALDHTRRIATSLRNLRLVGVRAGGTLEPVFVAEAVDEAFELVGRRARNRVVSLSIPTDLAVGADRATCARVLAIVVGYVLDATRREVPLSVRAAPTREGVAVEIGGGVEPGRFQHLPVEPVGGAELTTGLGMAIAAGLLRSFGGRIEVRRSVTAAVASLEFPRAPQRRQRAAGPTATSVLVVGSASLQQAASDVLDREGILVLLASDGESALDVIRPDDVGAIFTDLLLPGMSGLAFAEEVQRRHPSLRDRVWLATESRLSWEPRSVRVLPLPLQRDDLLDALGRRTRRSTR